MASMTATVKTKVTDQFTLQGDDGVRYEVQEHTRYEMKMVNGSKTEVLGRAYLLTTDGRGVVQGMGQNAYTIPSLGIKAMR